MPASIFRRPSRDDGAEWCYSASDWYYRIELAPGEVTPGKFGHATALVRRLLKHCEIEGCRCLDIGPMEGMIGAVLARRGASQITAIDVTRENEPKLDIVQKRLGFELEFNAPLALADAPKHFATKGVAAFDVVVFGGVLYHVLDIASSLGAVRAMVRSGGLAIIESWISCGDEVAARFNDGGRFTREPNTFWFVTVAALDYLLRFFRVRPLDCSYYSAPNDTLRLAVVCRAVDTPDADGDNWLAMAASAGVDARALQSSRLGGRGGSLSYVGSQNNERIDLTQFVSTHPPAPVTDNEATLWLSDQS